MKKVPSKTLKPCKTVKCLKRRLIMCIGVPGEIVAVGETIDQFAQVEIAGIKRDVNISLICEGETKELLNKWVLVHVGFAMALIDEEQARETMEALQMHGQDESV